MIAETITAFVAVVDRLIQLVDRREKLNQSTFTNYVVPVFTDFDALHKAFLECYKRYRTLLSDSSIPITQTHPVFEEMSSDVTLTRSLAYKTLDVALGWDIRLQRVAIPLGRYLLSTDFSSILDGEIENAPQGDVRYLLEGVPRGGVRQLLEAIANSSETDDWKREASLACVEMFLRELQMHYQLVVDGYNDLKAKLLEP
jgi:hypothetical protein